MSSATATRRPSQSSSSTRGQSSGARSQRPREADAQQPQQEPKNRPFHVLERFPLKVVIWENPTQNGPMFSVQLIRVFKQDEHWRETNSLNASDLLPAAKMLEEADAIIHREEQTRREQSRQQNDNGQ